jgi:pimeloyl-ACP methyl ester carboxylesterase
MKTAFVVNGLNIHRTAAGEDFALLRDAIAAKGYRVIPVDISWRRKTLTKFASEFEKFYQQNKGSYNVIVGNSYGAAVALLTAANTSPDKMLLCSLSPFFKEDRTKRWPPANYARQWGIRRLEDFGQYSAGELARKVKKLDTEVIVMYGEQEKTELPPLVARSKATAAALDMPLVEAPGAPHSFRDPKYAKAIAEVL